MEKNLFLDLEETLIMSWNNPTIINVEQIKKLIFDISPDNIHIFSAAIWDSNDVDHFEKHLKDRLEKVFEIKISFVLSMEECKRKTSWATLNTDISELLLLIGKFRLFADVCKTLFKNSECFLIDDMCENELIINLDNCVVINSIKI
jgi:hypothetical protein